LQDQDLAVGNHLIAGAVGSFLRSMRAIDISVVLGHLVVEQVSLNPVALAVDVGIDAMRPLGSFLRVGDGNVVGGRADPDLVAVVSFGQLPDADVMALGESVEALLEDVVRGGAADVM
jgi:hypothetical protein